MPPLGQRSVVGATGAGNSPVWRHPGPYHSSAFAERGFCSRCGSHIFHRPQDGPELAISAGLFDSASMEVKRELFYDAKPPFYRFEAEARKRLTASMSREWLPRILWRRLLRWLGKSG